MEFTGHIGRDILENHKVAINVEEARKAELERQTARDELNTQRQQPLKIAMQLIHMRDNSRPNARLLSNGLPSFFDTLKLLPTVSTSDGKTIESELTLSGYYRRNRLSYKVTYVGPVDVGLAVITDGVRSRYSLAQLHNPRLDSYGNLVDYGIRAQNGDSISLEDQEFVARAIYEAAEYLDSAVVYPSTEGIIA